MRSSELTSIKERPILVNGELIPKILDGSKTQTRRIIKPQPINPTGPDHDGLWSDTVDPVTRYFACPYGQPGDRLWVRETFLPLQLTFRKVRYRATEPLNGAKWKPSIHMPRWASRITLEILSVRVERLQEITDFDAYAEGAESRGSRITGPYCMSHIEGFFQIWNAINAERGYAWHLNPYVWVIKFRRLIP